MKVSRARAIVLAAATSAAVVAATTGAARAGSDPAPASGASGPELRMIATQSNITTQEYQNQPIYFDPGIYLNAARSDLRFDVRRAGYGKPVTITQVISTPGATIRKKLPASLLDGWFGLKNFLQVTVTDAQGKVVDSQQFTFCPNSYGAQRANPNGPSVSPYPLQCSYPGSNPFSLGAVWGLSRGWAVDPFGPFGAVTMPWLPDGQYKLTEAINVPYLKLLGIPAAAAAATIGLTVAPGQGCAPPGCTPKARRHPGGQLPSLPQAPTLDNPPPQALPQLTALPSWGITTDNQTGRDQLDFGATVWVGGNSPLDVEGFRVPNSPTLTAFQYFWRNGHVIGRARVGTMSYDDRPGHDHWHFEQFAQYSLLDAAKRLVMPSQKVGFCIAPTDPVNMLIPGADWQPTFLGLTGACGMPTAMWVREYMPVGWGDTYVQSIPGQAFDITGVPNGTYYIEITANPGHQLRELSTAGNTSLRKVILGGTAGHRTVQVPAWHGIDQEP